MICSRRSTRCCATYALTGPRKRRPQRYSVCPDPLSIRLKRRLPARGCRACCRSSGDPRGRTNSPPRSWVSLKSGYKGMAQYMPERWPRKLNLNSVSRSIPEALSVPSCAKKSLADIGYGSVRGTSRQCPGGTTAGRGDGGLALPRHVARAGPLAQIADGTPLRRPPFTAALPAARQYVHSTGGESRVVHLSGAYSCLLTDFRK